MTKPDRDPRNNPMPGDVLRREDGYVRVTVVSLTLWGTEVCYLRFGVEAHAIETREEWRKNSVGAVAVVVVEPMNDERANP